MPIENPFTRLFFFNDTATTEIYTLSLHDALPISRDHGQRHHAARRPGPPARARRARGARAGDRKSTRLNSSHSQISYAVFCLKKKKKTKEKLKKTLTPVYEDDLCAQRKQRLNYTV